jgi:hypothetical protein
MFTNALAGGVLGATYLAVLALQLNPQVSLVSMTAVHWFMVFVGLYGFHLTVAFSLMMLVRDEVAMRALSPAWLSVRLLAWFGAVLAGGAAAITWANLKGFRAVLDDDAFQRMRAGATVLTVSAALLLFLLVVRYSFGRRGGRPTGVLLLITLLASVLGPLWLRGAGGLPMPVVRRAGPAPPLLGDLARERAAGERAPHVRLILLDGASLDFIKLRVAAQSLPNFGRILDRGAVLDLATLKPTQAEPTWTAAATGKYPPKTGVRSDRIYRPNRGDLYPVDLLPDYCFAYALPYLQLVTHSDPTAASLRARTLWEILADFDIPSGIVRWPLTFPARAARGYVISDGFDRGGSSPLRTLDAQASAPIGAGEDARDVFDALQDVPWPDVLPATVPPASTPGALASVKWDRAYAEAAAVLEQRYAPRLTAVRYVGINTMSKDFFRYAEPGLFGDVRPADQQQYGAVLDRYYAYIDHQVGEAMNSLEPGDLLIVMSNVGMEAESLPKRLLAMLLGLPEQSGTHERAPDGFLLAWGTNVAQGEPQRGSIVDLAPTVLYYMGLPVGRDMDGFVRSDLFQRAFTTEHSITYIATYER